MIKQIKGLLIIREKEGVASKSHDVLWADESQSNKRKVKVSKLNFHADR